MPYGPGQPSARLHTNNNRGLPSSLHCAPTHASRSPGERGEAVRSREQVAAQRGGRQGARRAGGVLESEAAMAATTAAALTTLPPSVQQNGGSGVATLASPCEAERSSLRPMVPRKACGCCRREKR
ncbi:hypothetical protein E2C01_046993 [Portunus trituberculatus]|uniref:Uncharacterized protein n=1 Tax=Portunus trituberculatus TaxID=210409 RepID=A0A5B7G7L4_PORTR|nr:hypothetical protein [Portunus trituberculatus]